MLSLPPTHFLNLPRPDPTVDSLLANFDPSTLAAHDFDVDNRTGLMPPEPPLTRLPGIWGEHWETCLDTALQSKLQLGDKLGLTNDEAAQSERWRALVREVCSQPLCYRFSSHLICYCSCPLYRPRV